MNDSSQTALDTTGNQASPPVPARRVWDHLRLKPYGDSLLTPAVQVWLGFAWTIILLMATLEGLVWGLVGASIVPQDSAWLRPFAGLLLFVLIFSVVWIIDASLVMSERPMARARRWNPGANQGFFALVRWMFGFLARLAIVALSLYVTAPFLGKLIRADDIATHHQQRVEQYYAERDAQLKARIAERTTQIEQNYRARVEPLAREIERLTESISRERQRRTEIESEFAPELELLRRDLLAAQQRVGDEILGRDGRPEGRGREARKWEANAQLLAGQLEAKQSELDRRVGELDRRLNDWEQTRRERTETLQRLGEEHQARIDAITTELAAQQLEPNPPRLTFAARSKALQALQDSPDEQGVPHFETVEGFAQATLGVLFLSLIALKLFEPGSVRAYFSETLQMQYRKYLDGGLDDIPGFAPAEAGHRLNSVEFTRLWLAYEKDPTAFFAERQAIVEVREPLLHYLAERELERDRFAHRRENLEDELLFARRRRERELAAFERELEVRTNQLQAQLATETKALKDQRRIQLAVELQKARQDWNLRRLHEEDELRREREKLDHEHQQALEAIRLREQEIEHVRERSQARVRQAEVAEQLAHQRQLAELEQRRQRENRKALMSAARDELARLRGIETKQRTERQSLRETGRKLEDEIAATRSGLAVCEVELAERRHRATTLREQLAWRQAETKAHETRKRRFWPRSEHRTDGPLLREIERELKAVDKSERAEAEQLAKLKDTLGLLERRLEANAGERREAEMRLSATEARIQFHEDSLTTLLAPAPITET